MCGPISLGKDWASRRVAGRETRINRLHSKKNFYFAHFSLYICGHVSIKLKEGNDLWIIIKGCVHERPNMPQSLVLKPAPCCTKQGQNLVLAWSGEQTLAYSYDQQTQDTPLVFTESCSYLMQSLRYSPVFQFVCSAETPEGKLHLCSC